MKIDADEYCLFWYNLYILAAKRKKEYQAWFVSISFQLPSYSFLHGIKTLGLW